MEIQINLDAQQLICIQTLKQLPYLSQIYFTLTIDTHLEIKLSRISQFVEFLSENPTIKTRLKTLSILKNPLKEYKVITVGGTFDRLHIGHQVLLLYAALSATQTIHLGITADCLLKHKKYHEVIQNMLVRMQKVVDFIKSINPTLQLVAYQLNDSVGTNTTQKEIQCVVFSPQPGDNLIEINVERLKNGLKELQVVRCPLLTPLQKFDQKFSSTYIRKQLLEKNQMSKQEWKQYRGLFDDLVAKLAKLKGQTQFSKTLSEVWFEQIYFTYSQHWRFYHTNRRIYYLLKSLKNSCYQAKKQGLTLQQLTSLELALFFHNIFYLPGSKDNKNKSSAICQKFIKDYLGDPSNYENLTNQVTKLIFKTGSYEKPKSVLEQIVYDLQMGILNDPNQYKLFAANIRKEFQPEFGQLFVQKRKEFLCYILKEGLHFSFKAQNAESNIKWELQSLQQGGR